MNLRKFNYYVSNAVMFNINGTEAFVLSNQVGNVEALYGTSQDTATTLLAE